jgi:hypothetical protein
MAENKKNYEGQETYQQAKNRIGWAYHQTEDMVRRHPGSSALVTFGLGLGLGLVATILLVPQRKRRWYEGYSADAISQQICDSLSRIMPETVARHMR